MKPNSFLISFGESFDRSLDANYIYRNIALYLFDENPRSIKTDISDKGFTLFIGETSGAKNCDPTQGIYPAGTLITYEAKNETLTIKCDRLGTGIVYWKENKDGFLLSNRKENLKSNNEEPDWASIQQYLHTGYTIASSTLFRHIHQTEPNTIMEVSNGYFPEVSISKRHETDPDQTVSVKDLVDQIADRLSWILSQAPPSVLMMSAGWDSRTLLLEGKSNLSGAYTHGDLSSREINLAHKLTSSQRLDHIFVDVESCRIDSSLIDTMLDQLGFGVFPIWFTAAEKISRWENAPIMSGVLGELLGGHYGLMSIGTRKQRLLSSALLLNDSLITESRIHKNIERFCAPPQSHWFVSSFGQDVLDQHRTKTSERAQNAIADSYQHTKSWQRALEGFNMAHRARQYILKQAQTASSSIGYTIPFADEGLSDLVRNLDFQYRIHNKTNQKIIHKRNPLLLKESMAATLISARYPILFQEFSRFVRIIRENAALAIGRKIPRLGWFNYDHLYKSDLLHELTDTLTSDLWDKDKMHNTLRSNPENNIDAGSTLDMISKLKTVDYQLTTSGIRSN